MKKRSPVVVVGLVLTGLFAAVHCMRLDLIDQMELNFYDQLIRMISKPQQSDQVAVVDIDEQSLKLVGQWPWSRHRVAEMTVKMFEQGAAVVAYDVAFAEPDRTSPVYLREAMKRDFGVDVEFKNLAAGMEDYDVLLAEVAGQTPVVMSCVMLPPDDDKPPVSVNYEKHPEFSAIVRERTVPGYMGSVVSNLLQAIDITMPVAPVRKVANLGFFNTSPDADGVIRMTPLVWAYGERIYPSLALRALSLFAGGAPATITADKFGAAGFRLGDVEIPTDQKGRVVVNYRRVVENPNTKMHSSFPTYSAWDIFQGNIPAGALSNRIVFVGTSAAGLQDIRATPISQFFPGVEVHATIVDNILAGDVLRKPFGVFAVGLLTIVIAGVLLTVLILRGRSWTSFAGMVLTVLGLTLLGWVMIRYFDVVCVPFWAAFSVCVIYSLLTVIRFWEEEVQRKRVRNMFGTMVSRDVMTYLESNPGSFSLTGERREATMFFSDVAGFTTISEGLDPDKLSALLNRYLTPMTDIIMRRSGYVDKYEGDAIMAEWGAPFASSDHALNACHAALEQQAKLAEIRPILKAEFGHDVYVRMGLNSGVVTAGNMGSDKRFQYTVMGDAVNQASRFEPVNKDYGTSIVMGETTHAAVQGVFEARLLDRLVVRGKSKPIQIYELMGLRGQVDGKRIEVASLYEAALKLHWERRWDEAQALLVKALALDVNNVSCANLARRIYSYVLEAPSAGWQGEFVRASKD